MKNYIRNKKTLTLFLSLIFIILSVLGFHSVGKSITPEDKEYIQNFLIETPKITKESSYKDELNFISSVQQSTFSIIPNSGSIPPNQKREPKQVYLAKAAGCQDRSRLLAKILIYSGFKTRHIAMYSKEKIDSSITAILTPQVKSHAIVEVLTKEGWLVVDSNYPWISLDNNNKPLSIKQISDSLNNKKVISWEKTPTDSIYKNSFVYLYGVYSRHGKFYPPYNIIPDINYGEFIQNVL
jgi:hypothetical protein